MLIQCGPIDDEKQFELTVPRGLKIGFLVSSGADSAILLYLSCISLLQDDRRPETEIKKIFTIPKTDGAEDHSGKVVAWINQKLNLNLPLPTIDAPEGHQQLHHSQIIPKSLLYLAQKYDVNYMFMADQQVVPEPFKMPGLYPNRIKVNPYPQYLSMPFLDLNKSHTIDLHFRYGTEDLLALTHSCTERRSGRCGICYHCSERQWAFERLGHIDPGSN